MDELPAFALCPFCPHAEWLSKEDPDSGFAEMLSHIGIKHPGMDTSPSVLWPKIKYAKVLPR